MKIADVFEIRVEEKIEPVIKVAERNNEHKLAVEIGSYVVTPMIERYLDDFLEHYTDTFLTTTTEIGTWISGYFGSGKSHLAKILALLVENKIIENVSSCERFVSRLPPDSVRSDSIQRSLKRMNQCETQVLAFNLNTLSSSKTRELPELLLSQYYLSRGYCNNLTYARVIEAELDRQGRLDELHIVVEQLSNKSWESIRENPTFFRRHLFSAASQVAPDIFPKPDDVEQALKEADSGSVINATYLIETVLEDLKRDEKERKKPQRFMWVMDETGQWIENNAGRLARLQAFVEEASIQGQGKIWVTVTTHGDLGSVYKEARALEGDMKKIEGRFRFKPALTTENIEQVLENRLLRKNTKGRQALTALYEKCGSGSLKGIGELANTAQILPDCSEDSFITYYPFFPYQVHLIPDIVKSLRSKGGRGEQMSGSTRTLLAITQDILRSGRVRYLEKDIGSLVIFDEIYHNLSGEGEVSPDVRTDISRISRVVPDATDLTSSVAEALFLIRELPYIPRTIDNIARLTIHSVDDDLSSVIEKVRPELEKLRKTGLVARIGEEYEFLTGERRTFEDEVGTIEAQMGYSERGSEFGNSFIRDSKWRRWLGSNSVGFNGHEFEFSLDIDNKKVSGTTGAVAFRFITPFGRVGGVSLQELQSDSLHRDKQNTIFFLSAHVPGFDQDLTRYVAMKDVIDRWKQDPYKSDDARKLAHERDTNDLPKLDKRVIDGLKTGIKTGTIIFRGSQRTLDIPQGQNAGDALLSVMAEFYPKIYTQFDRVPVRIQDDQKAIREVLAGKTITSNEVKSLKLYGASGAINAQSPLIDAIRMHLTTQQSGGRRVLGKELLEHFEAPPFGWDQNVLRVGIAALVRAGSLKIFINKKAYTNPDDRDLVDAIRVSSQFKRAELELEEITIPLDVLTHVRTFLINLTQIRGIDETPAAIGDASGNHSESLLKQVETVELWARGSGMPLPNEFSGGKSAWKTISTMTNPIHRVRELNQSENILREGHDTIRRSAEFVDKQGTIFTETMSLKNGLDGIAHLTESGSSIREFIAAWNDAVAHASFANRDVWTRILSLRNKAELELKELIAGWKASARETLEKTCTTLPDSLSGRGLDAALADTWSVPLARLLSNIDTITVPAQVANLPTQARHEVEGIERKIDVEVARIEREKREEKGVEERPKAKRSLNQFVTKKTVSTIEDWNRIRDKMDTDVRRLIESGYEVELE
jgi:hypothetical protein